MMSADLVCCGNSAGSPRDRVRVIEAEAINAAAAAAAAGLDGWPPILVGGDFNLVGSLTPLSTAAAGLAPNGGDLADVYALQFS